MSNFRRRAFCYITRETPAGPELLVFKQDDPAAGIQTPGGTIERGEGVLEGAMREAYEESGIFQFGEVRQVLFDLFEHPEGKVECHHIHLPVVGETRDTWTHLVSAGTEDEGLVFHYFWLSFAQAKEQVWPHMVLGLSYCLAGDDEV